MATEYRSFREPCELREGANGPMICGYGVVFNSRSADMGFIETVAPEAVTKTLSEADIVGTGNHENSWLLGRTRAGTMRLRPDARGVFYEIDVNMDDPDGQRAYQKVQARRLGWVLIRVRVDQGRVELANHTAGTPACSRVRLRRWGQ